MRYAYGVTAALLLTGSTVVLATGQPLGAQVAQNDEQSMRAIVPAAGAPGSFADLTEQLQPAVVNISTKQSIRVRSRNPFAGTPFADFFGNRRGREGGGEQVRPAQSLGSGFIVSADGYVVTNNHVVSNDRRNATVDSITVTMPDGTEYDAELVGRDQESDLAVLKIEGDDPFPFVQFGDSTQTRVGDWVIAIGNPFGLGGTVTSGIISAVYRNTGQGGAYDRYLQTDASINSGNSGGPMFDLQGNVIGINNAIISPTGGNVGIGFAIPAEVAKPIVDTLKRGEAVERGFIGVQIAQLNEDFADSLGLPKNRGEFIQSVQEDGPADKAGIEAGDVVVSVDGKEVSPEQTLSFIVANITPGTTVPIELIRNGSRKTVRATVGERPAPEDMAAAFGVPDEDFTEEDPEQDEAAADEALGIAVVELTPGIKRQIGVAQDVDGVVIAAVDRNSDAARKRLRRGDVILSANGADTRSPEAFTAAVDSARSEGRDAVLLRVQRRGGQPAFIPVRFSDN
ncbi:Do family serine endopeptidase [Alterisphingorhabdus coralli]|uniref:Probable periplasmic serine endoprotease DegP-like n=1 Tax=Alterisphingorhabdus coralli TaxID=3071408 RepID=A0AA97F7F9_9SPHN|nr:Do family serine endopeptidase [Parasphingorhabdus sp. SCSIO 66989]WOE75809.1 Do family serine endopeptidase [Parasphingorhabdus sp. SCSIO 66989]